MPSWRKAYCCGISLKGFGPRRAPPLVLLLLLGVARSGESTRCAALDVRGSIAEKSGAHPPQTLTTRVWRVDEAIPQLDPPVRPRTAKAHSPRGLKRSKVPPMGSNENVRPTTAHGYARA